MDKDLSMNTATKGIGKQNGADSIQIVDVSKIQTGKTVLRKLIKVLLIEGLCIATFSAQILGSLQEKLHLHCVRKTPQYVGKSVIQSKGSR